MSILNIRILIQYLWFARIKAMVTFFRSFFKILRTRPAHLYRNARGYVLFILARLWITLFKPAGVILGENVRIQNPASLMAEQPGAQINLGNHCVLYENAYLEAFGNGKIKVGNNSVIGDACISARGKISIGKRFITSWNVFIQDFDAHPVDPQLRAKQVTEMTLHFQPGTAASHAQAGIERFQWSPPVADINIGDDVWLAANVTILKGANIGSGCIVAANTVVVAGNYPDRCILGGCPARVIKQL